MAKLNQAGTSKDAFNEGGGAGQPVPYDPDKITAPLAAVAQSAPVFTGDDLRSAMAASSGRRFTLEESQQLIIAAFDDFDPKLGDKAREMFKTAQYNNGAADEALAAQYRNTPYNDERPKDPLPFLDKNYTLDVAPDRRWNLTPAPAGQGFLMRSLAAETPQKDWGGGQYDPANPNPHAVIEFQFDGTINSVVYMAHEMGHAIADDYGREAGHTAKDNPKDIAEMQAYLTQNIVSTYLMKHPDQSIAQAAKQHFDATMAFYQNDLKGRPAMGDRAAPILTIRGLGQDLSKKDPETRRRISEMLWGRQGPKNINEVLAADGYKTDDDMKALARLATQPTGDDATSAQPETQAKKTVPQSTAAPAAP